MKSLLILLAAAFVSILVLAQQAPAPSPSATPAPTPATSGTVPAPTASVSPAGNAHEAASTVSLPGQPAGATLEKNIPLIPETAPANSEAATHHRPRSGPTPRLVGTFQVEKDIRTRIRLRIAETRALQDDPSIEADWVAAHRAPTDPQRRVLLAAYYNHLYERIVKLDPSIATLASVRRQAAIERMRYNRLGELDNSEDPFVSPTPEPSGPNPPVPDTTPTP